MQNLSYENEFCMQFHSHANQSHFHKNGFALKLALKQRHKGTRKWPIISTATTQTHSQQIQLLHYLRSFSSHLQSVPNILGASVELSSLYICSTHLSLYAGSFGNMY